MVKISDDCPFESCPFFVDQAVEQRRQLVVDAIDCPFESCPLFADQASKQWRQLVADEIAARRVVFVYQPIATRSGIHNEEALARLIDEDGSLIPACKWIDAVASSARLSIALDQYVLETQIERLAKERSSRRVWINLTVYSLKRFDIVSLLQELLEQHQVDARLLCLEITEQTTTDDAAQAIARIKRAVGCQIALDDLGSGYSNLRALTVVPMDAIKLDGRIIQSYQSQRSADLIKLIARLAWRWKILCVAEWIESTEQLETLLSWGVTGMQGHLITDSDERRRRELDLT